MLRRRVGFAIPKALGPVAALCIAAAPIASAAPGPGRSCATALTGALEKELDPLAGEAGAALASERLRVLAGPGFGLIVAGSGLAELGCAPAPVVRTGLARVVLAAEDELGVDALLAVVLTTRPPSCSSIHYSALANDTHGIGYAHVDARELFDDTPRHRLEGIAFLSDWPYWQTRPEEFESAFAHELGHRWGARMHARVRAVPSSVLLGREQNHWSYYFDSAGSPLEGNVWREQGASSAEQALHLYGSATPLYPGSFSPFDLYAMGALPPESVPPATLLLAAAASEVDCLGAPLSRASPPQTCGPLLLEAEPVSVSIEDVIAIEGERRPPAEAARRSVSVVVLVLHDSNAEWRQADCLELSRALRARLAGFERAASGLVRLENAIVGDLACDDLVRAASLGAQGAGASLATLPPESSGCALSASRGRGHADGPLAGCVNLCAAVLLGRQALRARRARHRD